MPNNTESPPILLRLNEHGQEELTRFFMQNRAHLLHLIAKRLNKMLSTRLDASDVVQDVYILARKKLDEYLESPNIPPIVWLRILCRDLVAETTQFQCRAKRNPACEMFLGDHDVLADVIAVSATSIGSTLSKAETVEKIREAMSTVSETNREIIEMRHTEKMTFQEIADRFELKTETVKKRYYRAISKLGQVLS